MEYLELLLKRVDPVRELVLAEDVIEAGTHYVLDFKHLLVFAHFSHLYVDHMDSLHIHIVDRADIQYVM